MNNIAIIDYGMGNLYSVAKAVEHAAGSKNNIVVTSDADVIAASDKVIFPGQGAAKNCMSALQQCDLESVIIDAAPCPGKITLSLAAITSASEVTTILFFDPAACSTALATEYKFPMP